MEQPKPVQLTEKTPVVVQPADSLTEKDITGLYLTYRVMLVEYAKIFLDSIADCEEIVQELFEYLLLKRQCITVNISIKAYLKSAVRNRIYNHFRKEKSLQKLHLKAQSFVPVAYDLNAQVAAADLQAHIENTLNIKSISSSKRLYLLKKRDGFTMKELANHFNISEAAVEKKIRKAHAVIIRKFNIY